MMPQETIRTAGLTRAFGGKEALSDLTLSLSAGEVCGVLGPNGAGKTTLLKLIAGLLRPTAGRASVCGFDSVRQQDDVLRHLGLLIETPVFYDHLCAQENLALHLAYMGTAGVVDDALTRVGLSDVGEQPVGQFSLGMRQRLALARATVHRPAVLLLDEPLNGLDPIAVRDMRKLFRSFAADGMSVMLSSHILGEVEQTADRVIVLSQGKLVAAAQMDALRAAHPHDLEDHLIKLMNGGSSCRN